MDIDTVVCHNSNTAHHLGNFAEALVLAGTLVVDAALGAGMAQAVGPVVVVEVAGAVALA